ncbi:MAG TPA: hypothetical protein IAC15_06460 [Candidatus Onthomonas avicola]|nr:hypothetical protein [Candidatus Onthomonas avicola]
MMRKCVPLRLDGGEYRLRLTLRGQRRLRERFGEETLQTVLLAAADGERMSALLGEALEWEGANNPTTDGEALYDLLVDAGYHGQERFGALAFDIAAASGLLSERQVGQLKDALRETVEQAFGEMLRGAREDGSAHPEMQEERSDGPFPGAA